jgi:triosephosphate isomerase
MRVELDVEAVVLGHSERRQLFGETDEALARKVPAALAAGLEPILCVGESEEARDAGQTESVLESQLQADLAAVEPADIARVVVAYEPIWAIGTGLTPTLADVAEAHAHLRSELAVRAGEEAHRMRILYGGSVKPANARELLGVANVDGALVGGASLKAADFLGIAEAYLSL